MPIDFRRGSLHFVETSLETGNGRSPPGEFRVKLGELLWLDWAKMEATARWLELFVRETCARPEPRIAWIRGARDDAATLRTLIDITGSLADVMPQAMDGVAAADALLAACGRDGKLPESRRGDLQMLAQLLEHGLA